MNTIWIHRISHCKEVSYPLLDQGYLSIGFSDFAKDRLFTECMLQWVGGEEEKWEKFEEENIRIWGDKYRTRYNLWRFLMRFEEGDLVLVPSWNVFSVYRIEEKARLIGDFDIKEFEDWNHKEIITKNGLLYSGDQLVDLGYAVRVKAIAMNIPRSDYAEAKLLSRMKVRPTNADISDLKQEVDNAISAFESKTPLNFYAAAIEAVELNLLKTLQTKLNDTKLEKLIKWYFEKLGASDVVRPSKNEAGKEDGADADVIVTFEPLRTIIYVQAKHHVGETSDWAVEQIAKYKKQKEDIEDEYAYLAWVVSTGDKFSEDAVKAAKVNNVRLINGYELVKMLLDCGIDGVNKAFCEV
mgnify:CR=1 FL=1